MVKWVLLVCLSSFLEVAVAAYDPTPMLEQDLNYTVDLSKLDKGDFQYFYSLLELDGEKFINLTADQSTTAVPEIVRVFLPLDTKKAWDPKDGNYLAVAKFTFVLPVGLNGIDEARLTDRPYLQRTLPKYLVTKHDGYFHVGGSFMTPDFNARIRFLQADDPLVVTLPLIDRTRLANGTVKVAFLEQDKFGRVMLFRTAKMASALILYEDIGGDRTLVTQYILSNVINVPTRDLIRKGMIENLQDVVRGSREYLHEQIQSRVGAESLAEEFFRGF